MGKKRRVSKAWKYFGVVAIILLVAGLGSWGYMSATDKSVPGININLGGDDDGGDLKLCDSQTTPDMTIKTYDAENVGTALTESTNLYRKVGTTSWDALTAGTAETNLVVGAQYEVVMGISTTDFTDNAYGPYFTTDAVPCQETYDIEKAVYNDEEEGSLSSTFYNADGDASSEVFAANQAQTVSLKILTGSDEYFGNPYISEMGSDKGTGGQRKDYPNIICFDLNTTAWDQPIKVTFKGVEMNKVSMPQRHASAAGVIAYCYEAPVIDDSVMESDRYTIRLDSDDSNAPGEDNTAYIYAANWFINADTGAVEWGVENEEGTAVGTDAADSVNLDFTA